MRTVVSARIRVDPKLEGLHSRWWELTLSCKHKQIVRLQAESDLESHPLQYDCDRCASISKNKSAAAFIREQKKRENRRP